MNINGINTRIQLRIDTQENWSAQSLKVLSAGEILVNQTANEPHLQVGDGTTPVQALPSVFDSISLDFIDEVCGATVQLE